MLSVGIGSDGQARLSWQSRNDHHLGNGSCHPEVAELHRLVAQLRDGIATRQLIGAVTGLVAARFRCTTEQAWALLTRVSQHANIKVREVARVIVDAHNGETRSTDAAILAQISAHLPDNWPQSTTGRR